jgi:hypothetical protein
VTRLADQIGNDDDILEDGEIWVYECTALLTEATTNTATVGANDVELATHVTDEDTAEVIASNPVCEDFTGDTEPDCCEVDLTLCISATGGVEPYTYEWTSSDDVNWPITSGADTNCITYDSGPSGSSTIFSVLITDALDCNVVCDLEVDCTPEPGDTYCTFTQGFWGNANGKFDGWTTEEWLDEYFGDVGSLTIGGATNSMTLSDTDCLLARMPAGGKPRCLEGLGNVDDDCPSNPTNPLKKWLKGKAGRYNNVLMGQVIALTLNMWVDPNLGSLDLTTMPDIGDGIFCTQGEDPNDIQCFEMPDLAGVVTVADLLDLANDYLNCDGGDVSDIYTAVTSINEGFDECRTLVACREVCDDGIDNDCDGDVDCEDDECPPCL